MNREDLYRGFIGVDEDILERSEATASNTLSLHRRFSILLVAALLALLLMGACAVTVIYGDSIQSWFSHYFGLVTGREMSEGQKILLDHLSQDISQSKTVDETTVTVDSATVGDDNFYLLLRVEGVEFSKRQHYNFDEVKFAVSPEPMDGVGGLESYGVQFHGLDGDGTALFLMDFSYATGEAFALNTTPLEVHLVLEDLMRGVQSEKQKTVTEGVWEFSFTIDRSQPPEAIALPDTEVMLMNLHTREEMSALFTDIELTNTGLRFRYDYGKGALAIVSQLEVVLENGATIGDSGGSGIPIEDGTTLNCSYQWRVPINLDEVKAVRIGETEILVR